MLYNEEKIAVLGLTSCNLLYAKESSLAHEEQLSWRFMVRTLDYLPADVALAKEHIPMKSACRRSAGEILGIPYTCRKTLASRRSCRYRITIPIEAHILYTFTGGKAVLLSVVDCRCLWAMCVSASRCHYTPLRQFALPKFTQAPLDERIAIKITSFGRCNKIMA